jgi:hypothetical protein
MRSSRGFHHVIFLGSLFAMLALGLDRPVFADVVVNTFVPFNTVVSNACTGEAVTLSGDLHIMLTIQETGNGLRIGTHAQPVGLTGTGALSGATYHGVGITRENFFVDPPGVFDSTFVNNFYIIGEGGAPNFMVHITAHLTVNANGEVTADIVNINVTCVS